MSKFNTYRENKLTPETQARLDNLMKEKRELQQEIDKLQLTPEQQCHNLFLEFEALAKEVDHLKTIVQNFCSLSEDNINAWNRESDHICSKLSELVKKTQRFVYIYMKRNKEDHHE